MESNQQFFPQLPDSLLTEYFIKNYQGVVDKVSDYFLRGAGRNLTYNKLAELTDRFGNRLAGSEALEKALDFALDGMSSDGLKTSSEPVMVPHWVPLGQTLEMLSPRKTQMAVLALGPSVGTPSSGIRAQVLVVSSFDELKNRSKEACGKIVVFNEPYVSYGISVAYRGQGAVAAARVGALAALVRSVTPFSIYSPHTGMLDYDSSVKRIPAASITVEDAEMLARMQARGQTIELFLNLSVADYGLAQSRNIIADLPGNTFPDEIVLISGHMDSWYVGVGAMDDGGGAMISWQALSALKALGLTAKRTIRTVLWTGEEYGGYGGQAYYERHRDEAAKYSIVMESDIGTFRPLGIEFTGSDAAVQILNSLVPLLAPLNASALFVGAGGGTDIEDWPQSGVPMGSLRDDAKQYFYFHHSAGDTMSVQNPNDMNLCAAVWASIAYLIADLPSLLPR